MVVGGSGDDRVVLVTMTAVHLSLGEHEKVIRFVCVSTLIGRSIVIPAVQKASQM